jgi:toxin ParE1/3/4
MMLGVRLRPEALSDLRHAFRWYDDRSQGLGEAFLISFEACLSRIQHMPLLYPEVWRQIRKALLRRFPYQVFYVVGETEIEVIAVFHAMQHPRRWRRRV